MKLDCHTHGKLAKKLPFSTTYTNWLFTEAAKAGLDAICLTEHFNTLGFDEVYRYIANTFVADGDSFLVGNLRIFPGMEIDIAEGGHILAVGKLEDILAFNHQLEPYKAKENFLPFAKLLEMSEAYSLVLGCAHPFREGSHIPELPLELLTQLDFIDLNGKDVAANSQVTKTQITDFARLLNLPILAGSDTHQALQYGCVYNDFAEDCHTIQDLRDALSAQAYKIQIATTVQLKVSSATLLKRTLKEIDALGGDYVAMLL